MNINSLITPEMERNWERLNLEVNQELEQLRLEQQEEEDRVVRMARQRDEEEWAQHEAEQLQDYIEMEGRYHY